MKEKLPTIRTIVEASAKTTLHAAAEKGDANMVQFFLDHRRAKIDEPEDGRGWTALHLAAKSGNTAVVDLLLNRGANIAMVDYAYRTALHFAAEGGHFAVTEMLLDRGAEINEPAGEFGTTALHFAAKGGHTLVVELLLARGASVDLLDIDGKTPLNIAVAEGHKDVKQILKTHTAAARGRGKACILQTPSATVSATPLAEPDVTEAPVPLVPTHVTAREVEELLMQRLPGREVCALTIQTEDAKEDEAALSFFSWLSGVIDGSNLITSQDKDSLISQLMQFIQSSVDATTSMKHAPAEAWDESDGLVALRSFMLEALDQLGSVAAFIPYHPGCPPEPDDGGFGGGGSGDGSAGSNGGSHGLLIVANANNVTSNGTDYGYII